jgi:RecB family exonuclease
LRPWLKFELTRPPFRVKSRELEMEDAVIGPLRLKVRVDRVDVADDGGEIILDYKTGSAKPAQWLGERPDQPQVPLYAVLSDANDLAAVAFASVRAGKDLGLSGYEAAPGLLPGASRLKAESFAAQIEEWRGVLTALAVDFHSGDARVSPKEYPGTCRYCKQRLLCRLEPASLPAEAIEELNAELGAFDAEGDFG